MSLMMASTPVLHGIRYMIWHRGGPRDCTAAYGVAEADLTSLRGPRLDYHMPSGQVGWDCYTIQGIEAKFVSLLFAH